MSLDIAKNSIDWIFNNIPDYTDEVIIDFIGGEPLLEYSLIKEIIYYVKKKRTSIPYVFFANTNGTLLTKEMKSWFVENRDIFQLGLSLDGKKETHDRNRSNSFDDIDIDFFIKNYPEQGVKMTLSEYSLINLADNIKYIHSLGINEIEGVNLAEGVFDWSKDEYISQLIPQLKILVDFYVENDKLKLCMLFDKEIYLCESQKRERKKWCNIGRNTPFFDTDGKIYPCSYITPMSFQQNELNNILQINFSNEELFIDNECFNNCYIYPICPTCAANNYMINKTFNKRNKSKCRIQKLIALFAADLLAKRLVKSGGLFDSIKDDTKLYYTIETIKKIKALYLGEFKDFYALESYTEDLNEECTW
jgi:radical SAM protein with 4Fe4S-binding SPASM domain